MRTTPTSRRDATRRPNEPAGALVVELFAGPPSFRVPPRSARRPLPPRHRDILQPAVARFGAAVDMLEALPAPERVSALLIAERRLGAAVRRQRPLIEEFAA